MRRFALSNECGDSLHPADFEGAVVGGTGEFRSAHGEIHVRDIESLNERVTFDLD